MYVWMDGWTDLSSARKLICQQKFYLSIYHDVMCLSLWRWLRISNSFLIVFLNLALCFDSRDKERTSRAEYMRKTCWIQLSFSLTRARDDRTWNLSGQSLFVFISARQGQMPVYICQHIDNCRFFRLCLVRWFACFTGAQMFINHPSIDRMEFVSCKRLNRSESERCCISIYITRATTTTTTINFLSSFWWTAWVFSDYCWHDG